MMLIRSIPIVAAIPLLLAVAYCNYEVGWADAQTGVRSFWTNQAMIWVLVIAVGYACVALLLALRLSKNGGNRLRAFANSVKTQGNETQINTDDFPELQPIVEALQQKERQIAKEVTKINWIIKHIPGGLITIDDKEVVTMFNCPAFEPLGMLAEDIEGRHISDWHERISVQRHESPLLAALHYGKKQRRTLKIHDHYYDGVNTPMVRKDGTIDGAVCLFVDATDRVKQETELKRLDNLYLVGQMAASLGHEIRNPLTTIRGFIQLASARREHLASSHLTVMLEEIDRINDILTEFLQLAKDRSVEKFPCTLHTVIKQIMPLLESESSMAGVELRKDLQPVPDCMANPGDIKQMVFNLHRNAVEACDGEGTVVISTGINAELQPYLRVTDTGCGISTDLLSRVGTPFVSTKANGTGLGLSVCYSIAASHKAKIEIDSAVGGGTTVTITFPLPGEHKD